MHARISSGDSGSAEAAISDVRCTRFRPISPLRFSQCIHENVYDGAIGIFLLNNGNIVLSKDRQIKFVKRNLRWLNFSFEASRAASCSGENTWDEKLL